MSDSEDDGDRQLKFVLVGATGVGKTCIVTRYTEDTFVRQYQPTVGVDFFLKRAAVVGSRSITLQLWDIGSQALSGKMLDKYVFGTHAVLLVYDITSFSSFESLEDWLDSVKKIVIAQDRLPAMALVGNKCDLEHLRAVRLDKHQKFAQEHGLTSHVISAKTGESVALTFQKVAAEVLGVRLSKAEQEQHQPVVRAEIVNYPTEHIPKPSGSGQTYVRTAVCVLQ